VLGGGEADDEVKVDDELGGEAVSDRAMQEEESNEWTDSGLGLGFV